MARRLSPERHSAYVARRQAERERTKQLQKARRNKREELGR